MAEAERTEGGVILELLAYEEEAYLCVVNDVLRLCRRAGGIQRYSDQTIGESAKSVNRHSGLFCEKIPIFRCSSTPNATRALAACRTV